LRLIGCAERRYPANLAPLARSDEMF